jgi:tetratricopeptide (TPR) repeat protein
LKRIFCHITLFFSLFCFSQNEQLAQYYFEKGDFEKAKISFEELVKQQPYNFQYFQKIVDCYQQLKQFDIAEKTIQAQLNTYKQESLLVELGYNFQLQKNEALAKKKYNEAIAKIKINPNEVYGIANSFEKKVLLEYALLAYQTAKAIEPNFNFNYQMALLYGQMGNPEMMITTFLDEAAATPQNSIQIQNQLARYMSEDGDQSFNSILKKALITRVQKNQDIFWNEYLSWFYVQQKEFGKAFIQEKAIYKRNTESLSSIINLAQLAIDEDQDEIGQEILSFVLANTKDLDLLIKANSYLMKMKIEKATEPEFASINNYLKALLDQYGINTSTIALQLLQAHFVAFNLKKPDEAKIIITKTLELELEKYQEAEAKIEYADILLYQEKFNQALLYYSQVEENLKNASIAHEASLKAAKTSYFQGDFAWALKQFKELKSASTQLIANDALEYFLLINDNTVADSTQTALKQFAKGDYLLYQKRNQEATELFQALLKNFKGQDIEAVTLLRLGKIYEKKGEYNLALSQYQTIINQYKEAIYVDEALFFSAEIYSTKMQQFDKAKPLYEKIIFDHQDSIHFVEAQKKYRQLRGDKNL